MKTYSYYIGVKLGGDRRRGSATATTQDVRKVEAVEKRILEMPVSRIQVYGYEISLV
jgi:hypothetical protein